MNKNILINYLGRKGGTALYSFEMVKGLIENGASVYGVISSQNEMLEEWKKLNLKKLVIVPTYSGKISCLIATMKFLLKSRYKIKDEFKNLNIDVVYVPAFHIWSEYINELFPNAKKIITNHDPLPHSGNILKNKLIWIYNKRSLKKANDIILLSEKFKIIVSKLYNKKLENVHVIPHGIFDFYNSFKVEKNSMYSKEKINFIFFGRIERYKGLHILAKAYELLYKKYKDITLTVIGNGNFSEYEKEYAKLEGVTVINRWIKDEEVKYFFTGDNIITVLPYLDATQSGVINIAMMNKSLVIATNTGGIGEQVKNKETGLLIAPNNVNELVDAMEYAIKNKIECKQYIDNASKMLSILDWKNLSKILLEIINREK